MASTLTLLAMELRSSVNRIRRTVTTPSLSAFYGVMIAGALFISWALSVLASAGSVVAAFPTSIGDYVDFNVTAPAIGALLAFSFIAGMLGNGPLPLLQPADEFALMPAPVRPHQLFFARYVKRIGRRFVILTIMVLILIPMALQGGISLWDVVWFLVSGLVLLEFMFLVSVLGFFVRRSFSSVGVSKMVRALALLAAGGIALGVISLMPTA